MGKRGGRLRKTQGMKDFVQPPTGGPDAVLSVRPGGLCWASEAGLHHDIRKFLLEESHNTPDDLEEQEAKETKSKEEMARYIEEQEEKRQWLVDTAKNQQLQEHARIFVQMAEKEQREKQKEEDERREQIRKNVAKWMANRKEKEDEKAETLCMEWEDKWSAIMRKVANKQTKNKHQMKRWLNKAIDEFIGGEHRGFVDHRRG